MEGMSITFASYFLADFTFRCELFSESHLRNFMMFPPAFFGLVLFGFPLDENAQRQFLG